MDSKTAKKLDSLIARMGYPSRSSFFTAAAYAALGEKNGDADANADAETNADANAEMTRGSLPESVTAWLSQNAPALSEKEIRAKLTAIIDTVLMPVVALRGAALAADTAWEEIRREFREQHGIWLTESEIRETIEQYELLNKAKLEEHRKRTLEGEHP
ncbi:MAG: hypothetical protein Q4Q20_06075 [Methanocorpusculum sp.]|nr:hypothetical protein [Methanocorpusculum sp.]